MWGSVSSQVGLDSDTSSGDGRETDENINRRRFRNSLGSQGEGSWGSGGILW